MLFRSHNIPIQYDTLVLRIKNRAGDGLCPMESRVWEIDDPLAAYEALKNYTGKFMVQSFNTMGLYWYRKNAPEILRGQLSSNLTISEEKEPYLLRFLIKYLFLNMLGRPDFISYKLKDLPNMNVSLCRELFGTPVAVWTLRTESALEQGQSKYNMCIFEKSGSAY